MKGLSGDDHTYDDIIDMEYHKSTSRPHMSRSNRAAQFAPFAALTGYDEAVSEQARFTEDMTYIPDDMKDILDNRLRTILGIPVSERKESRITYYVPDERKQGGSYRDVTGVISELDIYGSSLIMSDGSSIPLSRITDIT